MSDHQIAIPCTYMRGGTSKAPYFLPSDLPEDREALQAVLLAVMGSPDTRQIDGLGGADTLTSKVAIVGPSDRDGVDVDFLFAQVSIDQAFVDFGPSCGNILSGVGPFAIEQGLVEISGDETEVRIYNVNTGALIDEVIQTPSGLVKYAGNAAIDGVPGTAAPVVCRYREIAGSKTAGLLPTCKPLESIQGVDVTLIDVAMPMMLLRARDVGLDGAESRDAINANTELFKTIEAMRLEAGQRMGLGDVTGSVIPKVGLLSEPRNGGTITSRYLVPDRCHAAHAVTGGMAVASCCQITGTVAEGLAATDYADQGTLVIEHPSGKLEVEISKNGAGSGLNVNFCGVIRTARKLFRGEVFVPSSCWKRS